MWHPGRAARHPGRAAKHPGRAACGRNGQGGLLPGMRSPTTVPVEQGAPRPPGLRGQGKLLRVLQ